MAFPGDEAARLTGGAGAVLAWRPAAFGLAVLAAACAAPPTGSGGAGSGPAMPRRAELAPPATSSSLPAAAVQRAVTGNTVVGRTGTGRRYAIYLATDGTARLHSGDVAAEGRWRVEPDGRLCIALARAGGETCYEVTRGGSSDFVLENGRSGDRLKILQGNPEAL